MNAILKPVIIYICYSNGMHTITVETLKMNADFDNRTLVMYTFRPIICNKDISLRTLL